MFLKFKNTKFSEAENGFLNITAKICKEGVFEFKGSEVNSDKETVNIYYPYREFANSKFLSDLRKTPVIVGHHDVTADNSETVVGHVVSDPILEDGAVIVDLLIEHKETIEKIKEKSLKDASLCFQAEFVPENGNFNKIPFEFSVKNIKLEHIGLLPPGHGRMGKDVRVFNSRGDSMENENKAVEAAASGTPGDSKELSELKARCEQLEQRIKTSEDDFEKMLNQALIDNEKASEIAQFANIKLEKNLVGAKLHNSVLKNIGIETEGMDDKQLSAAFKTAAVLIKRMKTSAPVETKVEAKVDTKDAKVLVNSKPLVAHDNIISGNDYWCEEDRLEAQLRRNAS